MAAPAVAAPWMRRGCIVAALAAAVLDASWLFDRFKKKGRNKKKGKVSEVVEKEKQSNEDEASDPICAECNNDNTNDNDI